MSNTDIVEASATRGSTALIFSLINSSLYTGTVQRWWSTPNWLDGQQGHSQLSTGLPLSSGLGWKEKRSEVQPLGRCTLTGRVLRLWRRYRACGGCEGAAGPRRAKTSLPGRKMVSGPFCGGAGEKGVETSGSEDRLGASPAVCRSVVGCQAWLTLPSGLKMADGDHLIPRSNSDGEAAGAVAQNHVGAVVERLTGWNHAAPTDPDEGERRAAWLAARWAGRC